MTQALLDREAPDEDIEYILFAPEAYRSRRGTATRNAAPPNRSLHAASGYTARRTPPPPPLNRDGEPIHYGSGVPARNPASPYPAVLGLNTLPFTEFTEPFVTDVGEAAPGKWIKIVGVLKKDHPSMIRHFRKYGDLEKLSVAGGTTKNWVFMKFKTEASAAMAVQSNCQTIEGGKCFGVGLPSAAEKRMLEAEEVPSSVPNAFAQSSLASDLDFVTQASSATRMTAPPIVTPVMPAADVVVPRYIPQPMRARGTNSLEYFWDFLFGR